MTDTTASNEDYCKGNVEKMLARSQTKAIFPIITLGLVTDYSKTGQTIFNDADIKISYHRAVEHMEQYLSHNLHVGGRYEDAYPSRSLPKYGVLSPLGGQRYQLLPPYLNCAATLIAWIPERIRQHIVDRLGLIPLLSDLEFRLHLAADNNEYVSAILKHMDINPTNFEIFSFAVIKVHLEKFACKVYRDTRTSAHDSGVDLSTNFGVVYQIKKLKVYSKVTADNIYAELKMNFDDERISDGNVILVIDDISKEIKNYLINMKVQSISKQDVLNLAARFEDVEDRAKVLRIVYEELTQNTQVPSASSVAEAGKNPEGSLVMF